jgi:ribosome-binding factor A
MKTFRSQRVANIVRTVVGSAISGKLSDPRIEPLTSVTRVEVSPDLEYAKVFVSVMGTVAVQRRTMRGLDSATGLLQTLVARELPIRQCPRLSFHLDESIQRAAETIRIINATMAEYEEGDPEATDRQDEDETESLPPDDTAPMG